MARVRRRMAFGFTRCCHDFMPACCSCRQFSEKIKEPSDAGEAEDGRSIFLSSDASNSYQCKIKSGGLWRHRFVSSILPQTTNDGYQQSLGKPTLRPTISQRSHLMSNISSHHTAVFIVVVLLHSLFTSGLSNPQDAEHLTAMVGDSIIFNCHIEFPEAHPVPYVIQWEKKGVEIPIFIWYENYLHTGEGYEGRVSRVAQQGSLESSSHYGLASLNLTRIRESDQGWYSCLVNFLNRSPRQDKNGTLFHLNVHAPPRFTMTPDDVVYVSLGDPIILSCLAEGTPVPEILWYRDNELVQTSPSLAVANDGTELRISSIRQEDIGDYTCAAKNGQGSVRHSTKLVVAGGAVIIVPPLNVTRLEGDKLEMPCEARGLPGNFSVTWFRENHAVRSIPWLESRTLLKRDGTLVISPVHSDDRGLYSCEVTNGIGDPQRASAYIEVEYPARVTFTPTVQYLPLRLSGVIRCHVEAHPPFQFITWTKDKRIFDPFEMPNVGVLKNGSLLFEKVTQENQGRYTCTPYNVHGTAGSSAVMEVLVREPPTFVTRPKSVYQHKIDDDVQMACEAQGTPSPRVTWRRMDGRPLPRDRTREELGVLTLSKLRRTDFGYYECHVSNEVATLVATAHLVIEGTTPHAPYNITTVSSEFSVSLEWLPGYSGGSDYSQNYVIWYRQEGATQWIPVDVDPPANTKTVIHNLQPGTSYEFQVIGKNILGDGMFSNIVKERTKGQRPPDPPPPGPSRATTSPAPSNSGDSDGPPPIAPENVTLTETSDGVVLSWSYPRRGNIAIAYFTVDYCYDEQWRRLSKTELKPTETYFQVKNLSPGKTYVFRINSHTLTSQASSEKVTYIIQRKIKDKAITAGIVGGILFFIVAIILAVCTVKCVNKRNKRRRREQENAYSMVACQMSADTRNGCQSGSAKSVPSRKGWIGRLPSITRLSHVKRGAASIRHILHICPVKLREQEQEGRRASTATWSGTANLQSGSETTSREAADWLEYGAAELQTRNARRRLQARYNVQAEFLQPAGWISRTPEGKFVVENEGSQPTRPIYGYGSSVTSPVVESGVYRIGGDRLIWPRPKPILRRELSPVPPYGRPLPSMMSQPVAYSAAMLRDPTVISPQFGRHTIPLQPSPAAHMLPTSRHGAIRSSSPGPGLLLSPSLANFSDMSSVHQPSSADRSLHTTRSSRFSSFQKQPTPDLPPRQKRKINQFFPDAAVLSSSGSPSQYTRELPSLLPIHQQLVAHQSPRETSPPLEQMRTVRAEVHSTETPRSASKQRVQNEFGLLLNTAGRHFHAPPPFRPPPPPAYHQLPYTISYPPSLQRPLATSSPPRSRLFPVGSAPFPPGHYSRRSDDPLGSPRRRSPLTIAVRLSPSRTQQRLSERSRNQIVEYSPQSQSSSSGFDSKNTSQQNQSSQSGSGQSQLVPTDSSTALWGMSPHSQVTSGESTYVNWPVKGLATASFSLLDASVDNHYEFDTTQSPNETGQQDSTLHSATFISPPTGKSVDVPADSSGPGPGRHRKAGPISARSENIEARVQAMKEEFQEYRKRRARGLLESAC
ncbi:protein turtle isoform X2 [Daphnia magna]|nr:protein turtle isoform X2 [Daphnia magna]